MQKGIIILVSVLAVVLLIMLLRTRGNPPVTNSVHEGAPFKEGDRVFVYGGYDNKPEWLAERAGYSGTIERFIPGQNETPAAVIRTDEPVSANGVSGNILVMELRWAGATWRSGAVAHIELCDFEPESVRWQDRRQGVWVESHASIRHLE